jgi:hypothetical protein
MMNAIGMKAAEIKVYMMMSLFISGFLKNSNSFPQAVA